MIFQMQYIQRMKQGQQKEESGLPKILHNHFYDQSSKTGLPIQFLALLVMRFSIVEVQNLFWNNA
jgi:hypothetical protein